MRKYSILLLTGLVFLSSSCKKYLDVNQNPNNPTTSTPDLVLPAALSTTASLSVSFSNYGSALGGGYANAGGFSGFGAGFMSYNYSTSDYAGLWSSTYDNVTDYKYILDNTTTTGDLKYFNAVARTMKAFSFLRLVDVYGDVPYTQALQSSNNVTPAYDKAEDVYKACIAELNTAIATFKTASTATTVKLSSSTVSTKIDIFALSGTVAPTAGLDMTKWIQFANTIKLRALLHIQKVTSLASTYTAEMAAIENNFLTTDVLANPGYFNQAGKINPTWASWGWSATGALLATSSIPTGYAVGFYSGAKLTDDARGKIMYRDYVNNNQLGNQTAAKTVPTNGIFYSGAATGVGATGLGFNKGYTQSQPIMLAAEAYFLVAEANLLGFFGGAGVAQSNFDKGILASINYLDLTEAGVLGAGRVPATELAAYKAANTSYLVQFSTAPVTGGGTRATTAAEQLEAIITQKWIALNMITANESWNDYKRTTYPKTVPGGGPVTDMASTASLSTRADKLPGRILYPASEFSYNPANVKVVNPYTSLIFFDIAATGGSR